MNILYISLTGTVLLTHSLLQSAPISIQIYPTSEIEFLEYPTLILTNGEFDTVVRIILVLQSEKSAGIKYNNLVSLFPCLWCPF